MALFFKSPAQFSLHIEDMVKENNCTYIETILEFCDENSIEYDDIVVLISPTLKQKLFDEAKLQFSMPKETSVTLDDA